MTNSLDALKRFAESGAGIAIACPHSVQQDLDAGRLVAVPLDVEGPVPMTVVVCVLRSAQRSFAMQTFLQFLTKFAVPAADGPLIALGNSSRLASLTSHGVAQCPTTTRNIDGP